MKKTFSFILVCVVLSAFYIEKNKSSIEDSPVHWVSFEKAVELNKKNPKPILIDVYTTWCGPCKMMSAQTFGNEKIANYLNKNYYCVKFDAETFDTVKLVTSVPDTIRDKNGKFLKVQQKDQIYPFFNNAPVGTKRSPHQFAVSLLDGQLSYPSIVFLNSKIQRINTIKGFHNPQQFEPIMKFIGSGDWEKIKYEDYQKTFKSEFY